MDPFIVGTVVFLLGLAAVFGGYTFYKRNIKAGAESTDPHKFSQ